MKFHQKLEFKTRSYIKRTPVLYFGLSKLQKSKEGMLVDANTDLCVEGFPRSANSFVAGAIRGMDNQKINIAHHTHAPAQVMQACRLNIPTMVLIRKPGDAVLSYRGLQLEVNLVEKNEKVPVSFRELLLAWIGFYQSLKQYRDSYVVGPFEEVTGNLQAVVKRLNEKFTTEFSVKEQMDERGYHALPSDRRNALKEKAGADFEKEKQTFNLLLKKANQLYEEFIFET